MPTPESAAFLAKKPTVPPTFDGVDYNDTDRLKAAQDAIIKEQWVKSMMARLVREEMGKCYYREGVNHLEKCGKLRGMYHYNPWYTLAANMLVNRTLPRAFERCESQRLLVPTTELCAKRRAMRSNGNSKSMDAWLYGVGGYT